MAEYEINDDRITKAQHDAAHRQLVIWHSDLALKHLDPVSRAAVQARHDHLDKYLTYKENHDLIDGVGPWIEDTGRIDLPSEGA